MTSCLFAPSRGFAGLALLLLYRRPYGIGSVYESRIDVLVIDDWAM
jgi:hypothetical protein